MKKPKKTVKLLAAVLTGICVLILALGSLCFFSASWYVHTYGQMGFDSVLFTLTTSLNGVSTDLLRAYAAFVLPRMLGVALVCVLLLAHPGRHLVLTLFRKLRIRLYPLPRLLSRALCVLVGLLLTVQAANISQLSDYLKALSQDSTLFQEEYVDPLSTQITFPEQKRNLIYIFLESMETTFLSQEEGGALAYNTIPELTQLARENINFSQNEDVGGFLCLGGGVWTMGAMVSHSSGLPLKMPPNVGGNEYGTSGNFLPGVTSLGDILHNAGYYQALMVGSDSAFGGRSVYYSQHGADQIYDLFTAREEGLIPQDYYRWWGMEDLHLYDYAQEKLTEMAAQEQPFAFTMLTVDTHHVDGYFCDLCQQKFPEQYENVMSCASRQLMGFLTWLQQQDFYENTTIVIAGDHLSMDQAYMERAVGSDYVRRVYNCIINPAPRHGQPHEEPGVLLPGSVPHHPGRHGLHHPRRPAGSGCKPVFRYSHTGRAVRQGISG